MINVKIGGWNNGEIYVVKENVNKKIKSRNKIFLMSLDKCYNDHLLSCRSLSILEMMEIVNVIRMG